MKNLNMQRLALDDSPQDICAKMGDGNIGALTVMIQLLKLGGEGVLAALALDSLGVYGSDIWVMYKDECDEDIRKLIERLLNGGR